MPQSTSSSRIEESSPPKKRRRSFVNETFSAADCKDVERRKSKRLSTKSPGKSPRLSTKSPGKSPNDARKSCNFDQKDSHNTQDKDNKLPEVVTPEKSNSFPPVRRSPRLTPNQKDSMMTLNSVGRDGKVTRSTRRNSQFGEGNESLHNTDKEAGPDVCNTTNDTDVNLKDSTKKSINRLTPSSKDRRKSKRRSSFVTGRISKSFVSSKSEALCQVIPVNVTSDVRLELFQKKAVDHCLGKLQEEFSHLAEFDSFRVQVNNAVESRLTEMRERGDFLKATMPPEKLLHGEDIKRVESSIKQAEEQIKKYNEENETWDRLLEEHKAAAEEAERERKEAEENPYQFTGVPEGLSKEKKSILSGRPNYTTLTTDLQKLHDKQVLAMGAINKHIKRHSKTFKKAQKLVEEQSSHIAALSFPNLKEQSPRLLIENVIKHNNNNTEEDQSRHLMDTDKG